MAWDAKIAGGASNLLADVSVNQELQVVLSKHLDASGYAIQTNEGDAGTVTGVPYVVTPEASEDYRARSGLDTLSFMESFNYAAQNTGNWKNTLTTMTVTYGGGFALLNASNITTATTGALIQTYRTFPLLGAGPLYCEIEAQLTQAPQVNNGVEIGMFLVTAATTTTLLDGACFRYNPGGGFLGVINFNGGVETTVDLTHGGTVPVPSAGTTYKYTIVVQTQSVDFWIDDILYGTIQVPSGEGTPYNAISLPASVRVYNGGAAPALSQQVRVSNVFVSQGDYQMAMPFAHQQVAQGLSAIQGASSMTQGSTANYANSAAPTTATLSNTAAGYTTLGGQFVFAAVAGAETDYALFAFQVPATSATAQGRALVITGVSIDATNQVVAVATTPTTLQWSIGVGSTAVQLNTAEGAATKARRVLPLGMQGFLVGDLAGKAAAQIQKTFQSPLVANAGEFVHIILKVPFGTATATETFRGMVGIEGYWI